MATGYTAFNNHEVYGEIPCADDGFTFIDFYPKTIVSEAIFRYSVFESFRLLLDRANAFLQSNRKWKTVTCESVKFKLKHDEIDPLKMTYAENGDSENSYIRGLRLWLTEKLDENETPQQIGYFNLIPGLLEDAGIIKSALFETLDTVIERFNLQLQSNPLPGRIITIETQDMMFGNFYKFDPDCPFWFESSKGNRTFISVMRIFYEIMPGVSEKIGVQDFVPDKISEGGIVSKPKYARFSTVVDKATDWCAQQRDMRFCNAQTLKIKVKKGLSKKDKEVNTQKMYYTDSGEVVKHFVRILRVTYRKPLSNSYSISENPLVRQLTCRTFVPLQLTIKLRPEYENLTVTKQRISEWVKATGARVLSAETTTYRIMSGGEKRQGSEASFTYNRVNEADEYWIYVIRLYLDGLYKEPPPEMLPAVPVLKKVECHIS